MTPLRPHLPFDTHETLLSYAGRLAAVHAGQGISRFLADMGVPVEPFVLGHKATVAEFAKLTEMSASAARATTVTAFKTLVEFRGEWLAKTFLARQADKFCPLCLLEDGSRDAWRQQLIWCFEPVHRCLKHGVWPEHLDHPVLDLREGLARLEPQSACLADGASPSYLHWLDHRLSDAMRGGTDWLERQDLQQVLDASLMIGAVMNNGHKVRPQTLAPQAREAAVETGFRIYSLGPAAITAALDEIRNASPARAVQAGPLSRYGALHDWLDRRCNARDPGPIRDILRDHIVQHDAVDAGEVVLGIEIAQRRFHTIQCLAEASGIERRRLSRLLQKLGMVPTGASDAESGLLRFEVAAVPAVLTDFKTAIPFNEVPDYIGASLRQTQALYSAGFLAPLFPVDAPGAVRNQVFARRSLDAFLARLAVLPEIDAPAVVGLQTIAYACQRGAGTTVDVIDLIFKGELRAFRRSGPPGSGKVLVSPAEALALRAA